jgi:hypothetical protein
MMKNWIIIGVIILVAWVVLANTCITGNCTASVVDDDFAKFLTSEGIAMAGTDWCSHCKDQKELFGDSFQYVDYHDCDLDGAWCNEKGIEGYPTWVFPDGQLYPGVRNIDQLKSLSGYNE